MFSFERKKFRQGLRTQVTRVVVAALLGSLLVPVASLVKPLATPAAAAVTNGSIEVSNGGSALFDINGNSNKVGGQSNGSNASRVSIRSGHTLETWVKFSSVGSSNKIFTGWTYWVRDSHQWLSYKWRSDGFIDWKPSYSGGSCSAQSNVTPQSSNWYHFAVVNQAYSVVNPSKNDATHQASTDVVLSTIYINGKSVATCSVSHNTSGYDLNWIGLGGGTDQSAKFSAIRFAFLPRYSTDFNPVTAFPTTPVDSNTFGLFNTRYDDTIATSCFQSSYSPAKGAFVDLSSTHLTGTSSCSVEAPPSAPTISNLSSLSGSNTGGTFQTITGTNLQNITSITVGGASATNVQVINEQTVTFSTPAGTVGAATITLKDPWYNVDFTGFSYRYTITTADVVITAPVRGATPQTSTTSNGQFTTTITWSGTPSTFAAGTAYTAQVTVVPVTGYTLSGVSANFFTLNGNPATTGNSANAGVFSYIFPATDSLTISTPNVAITAPVTGATPQTSTTSNGQFTTTISWSGTPTTFAPATAYTAQVTVVPVTGYTLTGVSANFFTLNGNAATSANLANAGVFTYQFAVTDSLTISTPNVVITAPVTGATPQTSATSNGQFTTTVSWSGTPASFVAATAYTATVTVTPDAGYTLTGVSANFFTLNGNAATTGNSANAGVFTYLFPATAASASTENVVITAPVTGATPQTSTTSNGQFTTTITWSGSPTTFAAATAYTATVTVVPEVGYTLTGVSANFFTINGNAATTGNSANAGVFTYLFPATAASITTANVVITAPVTGATPQTSTTSNGQYTTTITWSGTPTTFAPVTAYTATVTVIPDAGYTLSGVNANFFTLNGNAATSANLANAGVFTYLFPATAVAAITIANVTITAPARGATPQTSTTSNGQFTTTITWSPSASTFAAATSYTATVNVVPVSGYTLTGVSANFFTLNGNSATSANLANAGSFSYQFPATESMTITTANVVITAPVTGATPQTSTTSNGQFTTTITWSPSATTFASYTTYTANVTVTPDAGYTLSGVSANFFTLNGNAATSANLTNAGVFSYQFPRTAFTGGTVVCSGGGGFTFASSTIPNSPAPGSSGYGTGYINAYSCSGTATIPEGVTAIADGAFTNLSTLTGVNFPNTLVSIGLNAFSRANLTSVTFPSSVIFIAQQSFQLNPNLKNVTIEGNAATAFTNGGSPFSGNSLDSLVIGAGTGKVNVQPTLLSGLTRATSVTLGAGVTTIAQDALGSRTNERPQDLRIDTFFNYSQVSLTGTGFTKLFPQFTLSSSSATINVGATFAGYTITNAVRNQFGLEPSSYSISPSLSSGLNFNSATGLISGSPTAIAAETVYTITATNGNNQKTATFTLTVNETSITTANVAITAPVAGSTPQTSTTSNGQFTTTISWSGTPATFAAATAYTATVTVVPEAGYTLTGVSANLFKLNGNTATTGNSANAGVFTYLFPATAASITTANVAITAPVAGSTPQTSTTSNGQFTSTITWSGTPTTFAAGTAYTATVTVVPVAGYTLTDVSANFFTLNGNAATSGNLANAGVFTYIFPATAPSITIANVTITAPARGATPQTSTTSNGQFTTTITWSGTPSTFAEGTIYTAQVTVIPVVGYTLTDVSANFFTLNGNAATTANTANNGVFSYQFPATAIRVTITNVVITAPAAGSTPQTSTTSNGQFSTTISWSPSATTFAGATAYTATVTVTPDAGYTLSGVSSNFFTVNTNAATTGNTANDGVFTYLFPATPASITTANVVITAPVAGATPQTSTTSNGQFTTTITWSPSATTFAAATAYTATVTVVPVTGRTLTGVSANFFTLNGNAATTGNTANAGVFSYLFPATAASITTANVAITAPVTGATPQTSTTSNGQFTTTITWSGTPTTFAGATAYTATVTVVPVSGYTLTGVSGNFFTVNTNAATTGNTANAGVFSYLFPATAASITTANVVITAPVTGATPQTSTTSNGQFTTTITWSPSVTTFAAGTAYRATVTVIPVPGRTLAGVAANFFTLNGKEASTGNAANAGVFSYFFGIQNGSFAVSSGGSALIALGSNFNVSGSFTWPNRFSPNDGYTLETWVKFSSLGTDNLIFRGWSGQGPIPGVAVAGNPRKIAFDYNWQRNGTISWTPSQLGDPCEKTSAITPVANTWYHFAVTNGTYSGQGSAVSRIFVNGTQVATCTPFQRQNGEIHWIQMGGSSSQAAKFGATRFSKSPRYSASFTPTVVYPTTADSNVIALFNTPYDDANSTTSCFINADPNSYGGSFIALTGTTLTGTRTCSNDAKVLPPTISNLSNLYGSTAGGTSLTVTGTNLSSTTSITVGGNPATNLQVLSDTSVSFITPAGAAGAASIVVTNSEGSATYTGFAYASVPSPPTGLSASPGGLSASISFTPGSQGGAPILSYKYSLDGGAFTALSPAQTTSPVTISGLSAEQTYTIKLKAVNAAGDSVESEAVTVTPVVAPITIADAIITAPVTGATPQTSTTSNGQFTTTITWSGTPTTFAAATAYTANVTVVPVSGYTLSGVAANFFTVNTNVATTANTADNGVFTYLFPATAASISTANVVITAPVAGATPQTSTTSNGQFTTTITWSPSVTTFAAGTAYTANVTVTPDAGRTLFGVAANFFTVNGNAATSANLANAGVFTYLFPATAATITTANVVITAPATGATPQTSTTSNGQFTTTITWSPSASTFAATTAYTATVTVAPIAGYTLSGVSANFFTLNGNAATSANLANAGVFTYQFPATATAAITTANVVITAPATGATPQTSTTSNGQFTTTITWSPSASTFAATTAYTATVTVAPIAGYTLSGVSANFFTLNGNAATSANLANAGVFTYQFPATAAAITTANVVITAPVTGATPQISTTSNGQFTTTITWSPSASTFAATTAYTATVTVAPIAGYTLSGVSANFFTLNGNAATSANLANAGVFTYLFPATAAAITTANVVITAPVTGATPQTSTSSNGQFTTTITWSGTPSTFAAGTAYTATVTVTPDAGRTLFGVTANFFRVNGLAATSANLANAGVFSYQFPATAASITTANVVITAPVTGATPQISTTSNGQFTTTITWSPSATTFASYTVYTANVTVVPVAGRTLTGVSANFFTLNGFAATTPNTADVGVFSYQFARTAFTGGTVVCTTGSFNITSATIFVDGTNNANRTCAGSAIIPEGVRTLDYASFSNLTGLTSVQLPSTLVNINTAAFTGSGLTSITIPSSVTSVAGQAFQNCLSLRNVTVAGNESVQTNISANAFIDTSLDSLVLGVGTGKIGIFVGSLNALRITNLTLGAGITSIAANTLTRPNDRPQDVQIFNFFNYSTLSITGTGFEKLLPQFSLSSSSANINTGNAFAGYSITGATRNALGLAPTSYSISPALSSGLNFDTATGLISGTPTAGATETIYTITGINGNNQKSATYTLTVNAIPFPTITNLDQTLPNYGSTVNVTGTSFTGATVVKIGNTPVATFAVVSATSLSFVVNSPCCTESTISITTPGGTVTSVAKITPQPQLAVIATQPIAVSKNVGQSVTFTVVATAPLDGGVLSYQWIKGVTPIQGATSATLTFTPTAVSQAGNYYVAVYNTVSGSTSLVASNTAVLTLNKATPILSSFAAVNKTFGDAQFTITAPTASVAGSFSYQSGTTSVATVNGSTITIVGQGSSVITASFIPQNTDDYVSNVTITMTLTVAARQLATPAVPTVVVTAGTLKSFTVSWSTVSNAVAYALKIYAANGVTLLRTVSGLSGPSKLVNATDFPAIADGTEYKIGLVATGDANNSESAQSVLASVTTNAQYTITYNATNSTSGTAPAAATFITGSSPHLISTNSGNLARTSFSFSGWNTAADGSGTTYLATGAVPVSPTANLVLHPRWIALKFTVTYYGNNNTGGTAPTDGAEYLNGASVTVSGFGTLVRRGYNFAGWTTDAANTSAVIAAASTRTINLANIQLYAKWEVIPYTVIYNSQSGSSVINGSYTVGGTLALPADPTRSGYTFNGWFLDSTGGTALVSPYSPPSTGTLTLYAQWTPIPYTIAYNGNLSGGGSAPVDSATYINGSSITVRGNTGALTRTGYTFANWSLNSDGTGTVYAAGSTLLVGTSNVTFYARWIAIPYSVTYNATSSTGGSAPTDTSTYTIGQNVPVRGNPGSLLRTGYTFSGWTDNSGGSGTVYQSGNNYLVGSANISFHPKWAANNYTITYNKNGASGLPAAATSTLTTDGNPVTLTSVGTMIKTGFNFGGWSTTSTGSAISGTYTTTADVTLYAVWTIKSLTVTYSEGSATRANLSGFPSNTSGNYGTTITLNATVSASTVIDSAQHVFMGWSDGTSVYQGGSSYLLGETSPTFTALWAKIFAVRYSFNGGTPAALTSDIDPECLAAGNTCTDGQVITANAAPTRTGYTFAGWVDQNNVAVVGSTFTVASDRYLLYATWTPENYVITYNTAGGSTPEATFTKQLGQSFTVAAAPTKTGHTFTGWSDGTTIVNPGVTYNVSTSPVTLTAQWSANVYTVSYDPNGGSGSAIANVSYTFGANAISLPTVGDLTRSNFTFAGWSETPTGTSVGSTYTPTMSRTLYVVWTVSQYLVTYSGNGGTASATSATYSAGSSPLALPTATRANFTFQGWYSAATDGVLIGLAGATYAPASATTIYARWIQDSLIGVPASSLSFISSYAVNPAITATNTFSTSDSAVSLRVPAGSLPAGTTVTNWLLSSDEYARALLPGQNNYLLSLVVSWLNNDGTVPVAPDSNPLVMTITNSSIKAGARVYSVVGNNTQLLGVATQDGSVSVNLTTDPQIYVLQTKPAAPTNVTATSGKQSSSFVSWSASADDGGSTIINYTVTASDGQRCISATTSCNFGGLTDGTSYTFMVYASNGVGNSDPSTASASITPGTAPAVVVPNTPSTPGATTPSATTPVAPVVRVPVRAAYVTTQIAPQISKSADKLICTSGTYSSGFTLDGVDEPGSTSVFMPTSYIYNLLFNLVIQSPVSVTTSKNSASWDLKLAPSGVLVTCSVTVTNNSATVTEYSFQNTAATSAAVAAQNKSIAQAESDYKAALVKNSKNYQKALIDNRTKWRADTAKSRAEYNAELARIKKLGATKSRSALTSAALKKLDAANKKLTADYKASGPASIKARDLANKAALDAKNAAIAKANSNYSSAIESLGYAVRAA